MDMVKPTLLLVETPTFKEGDLGLPINVIFVPTEKAKHNLPRIKIQDKKWELIIS